MLMRSDKSDQTAIPRSPFPNGVLETIKEQQSCHGGATEVSLS